MTIKRRSRLLPLTMADCCKRLLALPLISCRRATLSHLPYARRNTSAPPRFLSSPDAGAQNGCARNASSCRKSSATISETVLSTNSSQNGQNSKELLSSSPPSSSSSFSSSSAPFYCRCLIHVAPHSCQIDLDYSCVSSDFYPATSFMTIQFQTKV